ncbi:hypothetical protein CCACVL1_28397 [Corchorus capsularis]|uniref:Uncharacterized protein n=1 Tax=Corchorus capsularis TaxID=210143 RepID=A0A1R3G6L7_COCAP|nr:hypothetical protein CCACVL1_28397 [Corchorus capsularis]
MRRRSRCNVSEAEGGPRRIG